MVVLPSGSLAPFVVAQGATLQSAIEVCLCWLCFHVHVRWDAARLVSSFFSFLSTIAMSGFMCCP
jgi:hypothetical protein